VASLFLTFQTFRSYATTSSPQTLYAHAESTTINGVSYYLHKLSSADGPATTLSQSAASTGRKLMGRWVYPLSGIVSIPASTWTVTYMAMKSASASSVRAHGDVDILIRKSDNTIRTTIATNVANSPNITSSNTWYTLTGTYNWAAYTIVDQTDYLEVDYYIEVTTAQNSKSVSLRVDDSTLALADQTKIENVTFSYPNQAPVASFTFSPSYPSINETVTFNASASYDPDGNIANYKWDFGDGNITTVTNPVITHVYTTAQSTVNYTVTLTVTDNEDSTGFITQDVPVTNPTILRVSLPAGSYVGPDPDNWLSQCWLLNSTGLSGTFTIRINNTHASWSSCDTHLIIALNNASYQYLDSLTVNTTTIPKTSFIYGTPEPYGFDITWEEDVYPTWFSDAYVVGTIGSRSYKDVQVSATFSNTTDVRMHFDAYGSRDSPPPAGKGQVTHNPHEYDSTVLFWPPPTYTLTVNVVGSGSVGKIPDQATYTWGTNVTLTATPATGWSFDHWNGDASGTVNPITVNMTSNKTITVTFTQNTYTLSVSTVGSGSVNLNNTGPYYYGDVVQLTAVPAVGWSFQSWSGDLLGSANPATIVINGNKDVTATFSQDQYTLTVIVVGAGSVGKSPNQATYTWGMNVTLTASASVGWTFAFWSGDASGTTNPTVVNMTGNKTATATFMQNTYTLTLTTVGSGSVNLNNTGSYYYGDVVQLTAVPDSGWSFDHWNGDLSGSLNPSTILINGNKAVTATFTQEEYTLKVSTAGSGSVNRNNTGPYHYGDVVQLTAVPATGWSFDHWSGDLTGSANPATITMTGNKAVTATFTEITCTLTITTTAGGTTSPSLGVHVYSYGTNVEVTAIPYSGYEFDHWELDGVNKGSVNPIFVLMNPDHALHAVFRPVSILPVGGFALPINLDLGSSSSLIPQIGLASTLSATATATVILVRRRKYTSRREH
jgi:hypothetical protein